MRVQLNQILAYNLINTAKKCIFMISSGNIEVLDLQKVGLTNDNDKIKIRNMFDKSQLQILQSPCFT